MKRISIAIALATVALFARAPRAAAWDPFLVENDDVEAGNERMAAHDAQGALPHYDRAARALPDRGAVHLDRGLALLEAGELDRAREAFLVATEPPAERDVRADAFYDLGLAFYRQADAAARGEDGAEPNHEEAQRMFREAADAFRQSLRLRPGSDDAGWNLELALRRIQEQEEQQQQQEQQQQDQQNQDQQNQDQQNQDQQNQDQQNQDQQNQDQQNQNQQDQQGQDQQNQDQQNQQDQQGQDQQNQDQQSQDQQSQGDQSSDDEQPSQDPGQQDGQGSDGQGDTAEQPPPSSGTQDGLSPEHRRVLDALEQGEDNLERHRAQVRAQQEHRRVEQDW